MSLFSFINKTVNTVVLGTPPASQQAAPPAILQPVAESQGASQTASNSDPKGNGAQSWTTQIPTGSGATRQTAAGPTGASATAQPTPQTGTQGWAGQVAPPADTGGVTFDFSQEALDAAGATNAPGGSATGQTGTATGTATGTGTTTGKAPGDAALPERPASVTGKTMFRVEGDEDRLRAWAMGMLQQERREALPLSMVTDATASPAAQAGSMALNNANTDLSARPARMLERA